MVRIFSVIDLEIVDLEIIDLEIEVPEIPGTAGLRRAQNDPSWVKVYPGSDAPSGLLATFTRNAEAVGAAPSVGRSMANCENTSL
jgi:hypothetical protein